MKEMENEKNEASPLKTRKFIVPSLVEKLEYLFNFQRKDFTSFDAFVRLLYRPTDPASLGVIRIFFGMLMMVDALFERGGLEIMERWGNDADCHFPLFPQIKPLKPTLMYLVYGTLFLSAAFVMLGYKFRVSIIVYSFTYWYILLLDKSYWNNHSYLFGITSLLLTGSCANHFWSVDALIDPSIKNMHVPYWNYFVLKFQFFLLYFYAGLKKMNWEWLSGYSMSTMGHHWVFYPFRIILTPEQIEFYVIHWFGFLLDLTIGFWMLCHKTRPIALIFCSAFHLMNSRLFTIGMFPYVCLATLPLFCDNSWPRRVFQFLLGENEDPIKPNSKCIYPTGEAKKLKFSRQISWKHRLTAVLVLSHCCLQCFLPYSHFITKGFNNWTNGLYGYSWDMMVHAWDTSMVVVKVVDNASKKEYFLDPKAWTRNDRWSKHGDMCVQYAHCVKENLINGRGGYNETLLNFGNASNSLSTGADKDGILSIYVDVWCSLNGRFQQRMFDPNYDLLRANWSPFKPVEWLLPLLAEYTSFRARLKEITRNVYSWSNESDVLFIADFPGMHLEQFLPPEFTNVSLTVLEGQIFYEVEDDALQQSIIHKLTKGAATRLPTGTFHSIHTVGGTPSLFMYTFNNPTREIDGADSGNTKIPTTTMKPAKQSCR